MALTYDGKELEETKSLVITLLETHWRGILRAVADSEDKKGGVSIGVKLDHDGTNRLVKAKLSYAVKTSDESEMIVRDPAQGELKI
ncbi:MAG: hypothetical protein WCQ16_07875 [Verrucomicrobiae bacterium]